MKPKWQTDKTIKCLISNQKKRKDIATEANKIGIFGNDVWGKRLILRKKDDMQVFADRKKSLLENFKKDTEIFVQIQKPANKKLKC